MKKLLLVLLLLAPLLVSAQGLKKRGGSLAAVVPAGWEHVESVGDLNKDGVADLVVVATPDFKENLKEREDGYVYNLNTPLLAVYFGDASGDLVLWKVYEDLIPPRDEFTTVETSVEITDRGTLRLGVSMWRSAGSADTGGPTHTYRWQNGDFFLIGKDETSMSRYSGVLEEVSENYLTWKRQVKISSAFKDVEVKESEKWTRIPRTPLKRLGEEGF